MTTTLDPVQIAALDFARDKPGVGWFMEQGLGKTLTALAEFSWYHAQGKVDRMIVVCPNSFKMGWVDEIEKHGFDFDAHVWQTSKKQAAAEFMMRPHANPAVLIVNYEAARLRDVLEVLLTWARRGKTYLVIDESIQIKGHASVQTKAMHALAGWSPYTGESINCRFIRILTGRPQTQGPHDLWGQLRMIGACQKQNFFAFRGAFCVMGGWENREVKAAQNVDILARIMEPIVFQAKKKDWLPNLPRKAFTIRDYKMSKEQQRQYDSMENEFLLEVERGFISVDVAIAKYAKLAQIQCGFIYDDDHVVHELVEPDENPRLQLLLELLEQESGKVCVVYRHRPMLPFLQRALRRYLPAYIRGGMSPEETSDQKALFNEDPECRIILLQCDASKYGHTLLGGPGPDDLCRTMIFFENSYSADTRDQIEDRIHRRGQTGDSVLYIDLSGSPLDRRITRALQRKDALYRTVFSKLRESVPA